MRIVIDLDGVICKLKKPDETYADVEPNLDMIKRVKEWKKEGHIILIYTSRHMRTCRGNVTEVIEKIGKITLDWLKKWEVSYDEIHFGKPHGDIYIDDLALPYTSAEKIEKELNLVKPNFVIPMAGSGKRFIKAGYNLPKYMIEAHGKTLFEWSLESLPLDVAGKVIFIYLRKHDRKFLVRDFLEKIMRTKFPSVNYEVVSLAETTRGQAETVFAAKKHINNETQLVIYNIDTYFESSRLKQRLLSARTQKVDGILGVFKDTQPKWSFVELDLNGFVKRTAEKEPISDIASTGLYTFTRGSDFVKAFEYMVENDARVKGEFYVAPLYNILIQKGKKFIVDFVEKFWCLGSPEDFNYFIENYENE